MYLLTKKRHIKRIVLTNYSDSLPLGQIITRITQERGSFADLTEESLLQEIEEEARKQQENDAELTFTAADAMETDSPETSLEELKDDRIVDDEAFDEVRKELVQLISTAQNESALSQDFISLLMSCLRPAAGTTSMSPHLKQHIPVGSLSADNAKPSIVDDDPLVAAGWKIEALNHSSSSLKKAALRLEGEASKEELYWESVLSIVSSGEVLYKIRKGDARGLSIKYGYGDAGSEYQDRGVAALRRRPDGTMSFQTGVAKRTKIVRVNLYSSINGERKFLGRSAGINIIEYEKTVEDEIKNARDFLFEEELFFEMAKEARNLISHRVQIKDGKIVIKLYDEILEIEFTNYFSDIDPEQAKESEDFIEEEGPKISKRASLICYAFHILLFYAHRKTLESKTSSPTPINTKEKKSKSALYIIRPLIAHILHEKIMVRTRKTLEMIAQNQSDIEISAEPKEYSKSQFPTNAATQNQPQQPGSTSSYLGRLALHPMSTLQVAQKDKLNILVTTGSPLQSFTPLYDASAYALSDVERQNPLSHGSFYDLNELEEWIRWVLGI